LQSISSQRLAPRKKFRRGDREETEEGETVEERQREAEEGETKKGRKRQRDRRE